MKVNRVYRQIRKILTPGVISILCGICFVLSLLPILYVTPYVRATGDDLNYSWIVHYALQNGSSAAGVLSAVFTMVKNTWYSWQGTWSSVALFCLQPGVWKEEWYPITVIVALLCICLGTWYFLFVVLRRLYFSKTFCWIIFFLTSILMIQYMPNVKNGIFFWTPVAHYAIPYWAVMMCMGWALRWLESGKKRFLIGTLVGMTYLGGAGYPQIVLGAVWFFLVIAGALIGFIRKKISSKRLQRALMLLLPLILEMIGFVISAIAPGNKNRGGEDFGFSIEKVVSTLVSCVIEGISESAKYFLDARPLLLVLIFVAVLAWEMEGSGRTKIKEIPPFKERIAEPIAMVLIGVGISCIVRSPVIYAGTDASGGVPDSYWYITLVAMVVCTAGVSSWLKRESMIQKNKEKAAALSAKEEPELTTKSEEDNPPIETRGELKSAPMVFIVICVFCLIFYRHLVGDTVDYICIDFAASGAMADYHEQMEEWLALLNDPEILNVELPAMNDEQGPYMLMVPLEESGSFSNSVYEQYYAKESVICVPRD